MIKKISKLALLTLAVCIGECELSNAQDFWTLKPQWLHRNDVDYVEPIRSYANGLNVAKAEQRPLMILVTQKLCPPCRIAKRLIEDMRAEHALGDCVLVELQSSDAEAKALMVGNYAPQLIVLDMANPGAKNAVGRYQASPITREKIADTVDGLPVRLANPTIPDAWLETQEPVAMAAVGATVIRWRLATEYKTGAYNGTFTFGSIDYALASLGRYLNLSFVRVNSGQQLNITQSSRNGPGAAWTNGNTIKISPTFRFINEVHCGMVIVHEFLHVGNGTSHHAQDGGIMGPNGGYLLLASDFPWMQKRGWKSALRPTAEPDWFKAYLSRNAVSGKDDKDAFHLLDQQKP